MQRAEQAALADLATLNIAPMGDPLEQFARLAQEVREWADMLRARIADLTSLTGPDHLGDERARVVVLLLERAMDRCGQFYSMLARLDIGERIVRVNSRIGQAQDAQIADALDRILVRLGHPDPHHNPAEAPIVAEEFRRIGAADG